MQSRIVLELNSTGFQGNEIDKLLPDFLTERQTVVGLTWYPSIDGPESFSLLIVFSSAFAAFSASFFNELGRDLYKWSKTKLVPFFRAKSQPAGFIRIEFLDKTMEGSTDGGEDLELFAKQLPDLLENMGENDSKAAWKLEFDHDQKKWKML